MRFCLIGAFWITIGYTHALVLFSKHLDGYTFMTIHDVSLNKCKKQCDARLRCRSVNYLQKLHVCFLNEGTGSTWLQDSQSPLVHSPGFIYVESDRMIVQPCDPCLASEVCQKDEEDVCVIKECSEDVLAPEFGQLFGNQKHIGAKIRLECEGDHLPRTSHYSEISQGYIISECLDNGRWSSQEFRCLPDDCNTPLVSGPNGIPDSGLTASTFYNSEAHHPRNSRLMKQHKTGSHGGWSALSNNLDQYIQAEFSSLKVITAVQTQGRNSSLHIQWVVAYGVGYSVNCAAFTWVTDTGGNMIEFEGNSDMDTVVTNDLPQPVRAKCIRLFPTRWHNHISLRFELLGC